jgi:serine/threonine-protein kinase
MLGSEPPFTGATVESIVHQHIAVEPRPVTELRPAVPAEVVAALSRVLSKAPADRFSPAAQFAEALTPAQTVPRPVEVPPREKSRRSLIAYAAVAILAIIGAYTVISRTVGPPESAEAAALPRLAVLPFDNLGSAEDEYFADGITEEITSRIAQISGLHVISRTSAMQYKNHEKTLRQIGEELSVDYVLEGTIRTDRAADGSGQVRVTPQLIRVSDDAHLWTEGYTADLVPGEIFRVQAEIAGQVAGALDVTLLEPERQRLAAQPTDNQEAYDYYLRGNDYNDRSEEEQDYQIAIQMYQKAVESDPDFALGYARLSIVHSAMWWFFHDRTQERLAVAREAVDQALRLDPDLPEAHEALGWYHYHGHLDYDRALAEFAIAQQSQPNSRDLFMGIGAVRRRQGEFVEALANFKKAVELDPRSAPNAYNLAETYWLVRNPVEAARHSDRAISLRPDLAYPYAVKAEEVHLRLEGSREKARAVLEEAGRVGLAQHPWIAYAWVLLEIWDGDYRQALDRLALVSSEVLFANQFLHVPKAQLYAQVHGLLGNRQLERAYYDSARSVLESGIQQRPDDDRYRSALGIAYAGLGRKEDAIREGELAVELLPMSKEAWRGAHRVEQLARIYAMVGEYDAAIDQLEILLAVPSPTAVPMLRIDPTWNPLRDHPSFQALLEKYGN